MEENKPKKKKRGRKPKYKTSALLEERIAGYFDQCQQGNLMPNIAGLCIFLELDRTVLWDYEKKFPNAVKGAKRAIESIWVQRLGGPNATGAIFYLKNAFHEFYKDRHETDITSNGKTIGAILDGLEKNKK